MEMRSSRSKSEQPAIVCYNNTYIFQSAFNNKINWFFAHFVDTLFEFDDGRA